MKNLKKIIGFFAAIFIVGIYLTLKTIDTSLNKSEEKEDIITMKKDTTSLLKAEKKVKVV